MYNAASDGMNNGMVDQQGTGNDDQDNDCEKNGDAGDWQCPQSDQAIPCAWVCDSTVDCPDEADEDLEFCAAWTSGGGKATVVEGMFLFLFESSYTTCNAADDVIFAEVCYVVDCCFANPAVYVSAAEASYINGSSIVNATGEANPAGSVTYGFALIGIGFIIFLTCGILCCNYSGACCGGDGEEDRTEEEEKEEEQLLAMGAAPPPPPGAPPPADKVLFKSGRGLRGVVKGLLAMGILPALYMSTSIFAFLYSLFEFFVFGTYADQQGMEEVFEYRTAMFACVLLEYYFLITPAVLYGIHGLDYEDAKEIWKEGGLGKVSIIFLPITMYLSTVICAGYTGYKAVQASPNYMGEGLPFAVRMVISIVVAPIVFLGTFVWIFFLPILWGASIGFKLYALFPWLYDKLEQWFCFVVEGAPAFRVDTKWQLGGLGRRRSAKVHILFHPDLTSKTSNDHPTPAGVTAGSAAFLLTFSLLVEFFLPGVIGVAMAVANAEKLSEIFRYSGLFLKCLADSDDPTADPYQTGCSGWDTYTALSVAMNGLALLINLWTILKMLVAPPHKLFNPGAFVGPNRLPEAFVMTYEEEPAAGLSGSEAWQAPSDMVGRDSEQLEDQYLAVGAADGGRGAAAGNGDDDADADAGFMTPAPEEDDDDDDNEDFGAAFNGAKEADEGDEGEAPTEGTQPAPVTGLNVKEFENVSQWGVTKAVVSVAVQPGKIGKDATSKFSKTGKAEKQKEFVRKSSVKQEMQRKNAHEFTLEKALRKRDADVSVKVVD